LRKNLLLSLLFLLSFLSYSEADVIRLKDGRKIDFPIVGETEDRVIVDVGGSNISLARSDIDGLEENPVAESYAPPAEGINYVIAKETISLGGSYYDSGRFDKAIRTFQKALSRTEDRHLKAVVFFDLSSCYLAKGFKPYSSSDDKSCYLMAIKYARKCLTMESRYWKAMANIATAYLNMNDLDAAEYYYSKAEKFTDRTSEEYWQLRYQHNMVLKLKETFVDKPGDKLGD